jgi:hypothetical protein
VLRPSGTTCAPKGPFLWALETPVIWLNEAHWTATWNAQPNARDQRRAAKRTDRCIAKLDTVSVSTCPCAVQSASVHTGKTDKRCSRDPSPARRDPRGPVSGLMSTLPQTSNWIIAPASVRAAPRSLEGGEAYAPRISPNGAPDPAGWSTFRCSPWTTFSCSLTTATRTDPERLPAFQPLTPGAGPAAAAQPR